MNRIRTYTYNISKLSEIYAWTKIKDYDIKEATQFIEKLLLSDYSVVILPNEYHLISALINFYNNRMAFVGLVFLKELENFYFRNLTNELQRKFTSSLIKVVIKDV